MQPEESLEKSGYGKEICKREVAEKREEERRTGVRVLTAAAAVEESQKRKLNPKKLSKHVTA